MAEEQTQSSWWGYASTAWNSIQETAKDFTESLQEENEETINQIKDTVDTETISNQISNATNSINTFLNTTVTTFQTISTQNNSNANNTKSKKQIPPKPFEKEKATYSSDPCSMKQHKDKYIKFIDLELGLTDDEICLQGRHLLEINSAICTYFESLVPNEIGEVTFWKRYFYWKYQNQLREILISRHIASNKDDNEDEEEDVKLGDCESVKVAIDGKTDEYTSDGGSKLSETSWSDMGKISTVTSTNDNNSTENDNDNNDNNSTENDNNDNNDNDNDNDNESANDKGNDDGNVDVEKKDDNINGEIHDVNEKKEDIDGNVVLKNKVNEQVIKQDKQEQTKISEDEDEDWAEWD